ncbi:cytochrome c oxidase subunit 3 [Salimicrobium halophilum]|uniref:Cytochrome c oxidase subunit 3 n=1 Tax=Salimicrobium halophilum TaxID=86666 RepID=A0A1G8TX94_9BACI|nr:cytochrome c oxidase subunit 3 [Salimicrobium halophilum]SDJ46121.1 cytochrome c oxidase subunit 3 [Salimicrobium halophilum]
MTAVTQELFKDKRMGFFLYLGVEAVMFLTLFATYIIFTPPDTGARPEEVFKAKEVLKTSAALLPSSLTLLLAERGLVKGKRSWVWGGLVLTFLLGSTFLALEINEFYRYAAHEGYVLSMNNYLASFYVLVGLHASHVAFGLMWMVILMFRLSFSKLRDYFIEKHKIFNYYWHFVDIIWVLIVLIVYLPYII